MGALPLIFLFSCLDKSGYEWDEVSLNPSIALPLVHGRVSVSDLLENADSSVVKVYPDGLVYFAFTQTLESEDIRNLFEIPDVATNISFVLPGAVLPSIPEDIDTDSISRTMDFGMDPEKIDEVGLTSGELGYNTSIFPASSGLDYEVRISIPSFRSLASVPLSSAVRGSGAISLDNYTLFLNDNKFDLKVVLILKQRPTPIVIAPGTSINVQLQFRNFEFSYIKGFLGEQSEVLDPDHVEMGDFGDLFEDAEISLANPKVSLSVTSEYGVPCLIDFTTLEARKDGAAPLPILLSPSNPVTLAYPTILGDSETTTVSITNVSELLAYAPTSLHYQATATINDGLTSGTNFVIDTSAMNVKMDLEIPLYGHASNITLQDTVDVDLSDIEQSELEKAALKLKITNELPLDGSLQFFLVDENYALLGVLLDDDQMNILPGSTVNASGDLVSAGLYDALIELDQSKLDNLFETKRIIFVVNLQTSRNASGAAQDVKFKADYSIEIEAGVMADLKLKIQ
jgi:hypothetical protein